VRSSCVADTRAGVVWGLEGNLKRTPGLHVGWPDSANATNQRPERRKKHTRVVGLRDSLAGGRTRARWGWTYTRGVCVCTGGVLPMRVCVGWSDGTGAGMSGTDGGRVEEPVSGEGPFPCGR
jgi:hypothetical protein